MTELREKLNSIVEEKNTKVIPENLKVGAEAFGVQGTFTSDATATAEDIAKDKTAYVNGEKVTGTFEASSSGDEWEAMFRSSIDGTLGANVTKLPSGLTNICDYAFRALKNLNISEIYEGIKTIGQYAFYECTNLSKLELPNSLTSIGNYAFQKCANLTEITIKSTTISFGNYCFREDKNLQKIILPNLTTPPTFGNNFLYDVPFITLKIYVPDNLVEDVKTALNNYYTDNVKGISELA
jgi:hypothetical protein